MITVDEDTLDRLLSLITQAMSSSIDGCDDGWITEQTVARQQEIEDLIAVGNKEEGWRLAIDWLKDR